MPRTRGSLRQTVVYGRRMTHDHVLDVVAKYEALLSRVPERFTADGFPENREQVEGHLMWMLLRIREFLDREGEFEKAMRWLGFVQGSLWALGILTIHTMREHNRA